MKKLLATTAVATMAFTGAASAESLLERVLSDISAVPTTNVTGIFSNSADNLLAGAVPDVTNIGGTATTADRAATADDVITVSVATSPVSEVSGVLQPDGTLQNAAGETLQGDGTFIDTSTTPGTNNVEVLPGATVLTNNAGALTVADTSLTGAETATTGTFETATVTTTIGGDTFSTSGINASVNNILRGLTGPTAVTSGGASATEAVDALIGNIATTALGAVNTGDIQLIGSNLSFSEDIDTATAGTSAAVQQTIENSVAQVGTTTGQTVLALNSALNETNVNASVTNVMSGVNATIGRSGFDVAFAGADFTSISGLDADAIAALTGGISTTGLGAVNTGSIISGTQNEVNGVISSIVGSNTATN